MATAASMAAGSMACHSSWNAVKRVSAYRKLVALLLQDQLMVMLLLASQGLKGTRVCLDPLCMDVL
jgi:hypothetical protein